jgi:hypothetical protein
MRVGGGGGEGTNYRDAAVRKGAGGQDTSHVLWFLAGPPLLGDPKNCFTRAVPAVGVPGYPRHELHTKFYTNFSEASKVRDGLHRHTKCGYSISIFFFVFRKENWGKSETKRCYELRMRLIEGSYLSIVEWKIPCIHAARDDRYESTLGACD